MKNGDVVFFQAAKTEPTRKAATIAFKGHAFGVLLGHVPPFAKAPPAEHMLRLMGSIGFISFDDVGEFFGDETGALAVTKFEEKYYGKAAASPEAELQPELPLYGETGLVGTNGQPISTGDQKNEDRPASL